jgi:hypothetical protein
MSQDNKVNNEDNLSIIKLAGWWGQIWGSREEHDRAREAKELGN